MKRGDIAPHRQDAPTSPPPKSAPQERRLAVSELTVLREMRNTLSHGRVVSRDKRPPEEDVRLVLFRVLKETLTLIAFFQRQIAQGKRCHIIEREHPSKEGKLVVEFVVEVQS